MSPSGAAQTDGNGSILCFVVDLKPSVVGFHTGIALTAGRKRTDHCGFADSVVADNEAFGGARIEQLHYRFDTKLTQKISN